MNLENDLPAWFGGRVLPVSPAVADRWRLLMASEARTLKAMDSLLAATALQHGLRIVTRNEADFAFQRLTVVNPRR